MKEKTFEELLTDDKDFAPDIFGRETVLKLLQQVQEATKAEIENKANEYGEYGTADYVHEMPTDRIILTNK